MKIFYNPVRWRRVLSALLALTLLLSGVNCSVIATYAAESDDPTLCEHHTEHSYDVCGYREAAEATPCQHICDWDCYQKELTCIHAEGGTHDAICGYGEGTPEIPEVACNHTHSESCGYVAAVEGKEEVPCGFVHTVKDCGCDGNDMSGCSHTHSPAVCSYAEAVTAVEGVPCNHAHNPEICTYVAVVPATTGTACSHAHDRECYTLVMKCTHTHDDGCGYDEDIPNSCTHTPCDDTCLEQVIDCVHTSHSTLCGYQEAVEASPCTYECSECAQEKELRKECTCDAQPDKVGVITHAEDCALYAVSTYIDAAEGSDTAIFSATLYTGQNAAGTGVGLTENSQESATLSLSRNLLQISWTYDMSKAQKLDIVVPAGLYIEDYTGKGDQTVLNGITVTFSKNQNQGTGSYSNENTGTLTYSYAPPEGTSPSGTSTVNLNVYVSIDQTVWDKTGQTNFSISGDKPAVSITNGTTTKTVQSVYVSATEARPLSGYIDNVKILQAGVAGQLAFQTRILTGSDRYKETIAWKSVEIQFEAKVTKSTKVATETPVPITKVDYTGLNFEHDGTPKFTNYTSLGTATVTYSDVQTKSVVDTLQLGYPVLDLSELGALDSGDQITVTCKVRYTSYCGSETQVYTRNQDSFPQPLDVKGNTGEIETVAGAYTAVASWTYNENGKYLSCLGKMSFSNVAFGDAYNAQIRMTFGDGLRAQFYRLPMDPQNSATGVTVTLREMDPSTGADVDGSDITKNITLTPQNNSTGAELSVKNSALGLDASKSYYIKEVSYSQAEIPQNKVYSSGAYANNAVGVIWGKQM